jgi:hypothetical protein
VRDTKLVTTLPKTIGATFAAVHPSLREVLVGSIEGPRITVTSEEVHDDKLLDIRLLFQSSSLVLILAYRTPRNLVAVIAGAIKSFAGKT